MIFSYYKDYISAKGEKKEWGGGWIKTNRKGKKKEKKKKELLYTLVVWLNIYIADSHYQ